MSLYIQLKNKCFAFIYTLIQKLCDVKRWPMKCSNNSFVLILQHSVDQFPLKLVYQEKQNNKPVPGSVDKGVKKIKNKKHAWGKQTGHTCMWDCHVSVYLKYNVARHLITSRLLFIRLTTPLLSTEKNTSHHVICFLQLTFMCYTDAFVIDSWD